MRRFLPSSLLGQVTLVLAIGLLVAQAVSAFALYRAQEQRRDASLVSAIAFRLIAANAGRLGPELRRARLERRLERREERLERMRELGAEAPRRLPGPPPPSLDGVRAPPSAFTRLLRISLQQSDASPVLSSERRFEGYEAQLRRLLEEQDFNVGEIRITRRIAGEDSHVLSIMEDMPIPRFFGWRERRLIVAAIEDSAADEWLTVRLPEPERERGGIALIFLQTAVIFTVLLTLLFLVLRRITRPLAALTSRLSDFSLQPDRPERLVESGPRDTRRLISAYNTMETRIAALLDEKNVMLGAIGHDLKTPLAALRVRIESHPDAAQREALASTIEDITKTLDDILLLARVGADAQARELVDLTALTRGVVEEFEDMGQTVSLDESSGSSARVVALVQETWIKRALRNLVSNAVRYGGEAKVRVTLAKPEPFALITVVDHGPGIPEERIADMLEPFTRGETSRNRATGGTGLGLTLARAVAQAHSGELTLRNRSEGGLAAELRLPI